MTDILTQLRTWTADKLEGRTDFDDLAPATYTRRVPQNMVRIVEGADDLKPAIPSMGGSGMTNYANMGTDPRPILNADGRSERQAELMTSLVSQLEDLDTETGAKARAYTEGMTEHGKWTAGREGNASAWIGRMIAKVRELKANRPVATPTTDDFSNVPVGYYALATDAGIKFYRVTRSDAGRTYLRVQASDEFHLIRNLATKTQIMNAILADVRGAHALYGQHIGRCGRCHRTLTDELSRSRGIGPDCWEKI
jgi:hypothetical protein